MNSETKNNEYYTKLAKRRTSGGFEYSSTHGLLYIRLSKRPRRLIENLPNDFHLCYFPIIN